MIHTLPLLLLGLAPAGAVRSELGQAAAGAEYDEAEAFTYLHYARASFCEPCSLSRWDCGESCSQSPVIPSTVRHLGPGAKSGVRGYVAGMPGDGAGGTKRCIVAFKGSTSIGNWIADAKFKMSAWPAEPGSGCPGCAVHHGFAGGYAEIEAALLGAIRELGCERVSVAGHSLGAAIATLATYTIRTTLGLIAEPVYLFGAPRVGNAAFVESFVAAAQGTVPPAWRVIHDRDPVPRAPPDTSVLGGYTHFPQEVYYTEREDAFRTCSAEDGEDAGCAKSRSMVQCMLYVSQHTTYFNLTTISLQMPHECILRSAKDDCQREAGTRICECEVVFYMGSHTSFSNPKRKAWETLGQSCEDELPGQLSLRESVGVKDRRCNAKPQTCECEVVFYMGAHTSYANPKRKAWESRGGACGDELPDHLSFQESMGMKESKCIVKHAA